MTFYDLYLKLKRFLVFNEIHMVYCSSMFPHVHEQVPAYSAFWPRVLGNGVNVGVDRQADPRQGYAK